MLERGTLESFAAWLENDAREVLWAKMADDLGVPVSKNTPADASRYWDELATAFASVFGFAPGMSDEEVIAVATQALLSGTPEARSGRSELRSLRPRLRQLYPLTEPAPAS